MYLRNYDAIMIYLRYFTAQTNYHFNEGRSYLLGVIITQLDVVTPFQLARMLGKSLELRMSAS